MTASGQAPRSAESAIRSRAGINRRLRLVTDSIFGLAHIVGVLRGDAAAGSLRRGAKLARDPVECLGSANCRPLGERGMRG
jgi:hypothetical protein